METKDLTVTQSKVNTPYFSSFMPSIASEITKLSIAKIDLTRRLDSYLYQENS